MVRVSSTEEICSRTSVISSRNGQLRGLGQVQLSVGFTAAHGTGAIGPSMARITSPTVISIGRFRKV